MPNPFTLLDLNLTLLRSAKRGHLFELQKALALGADSLFYDSSSRTALHLAAQEGHPDCVALLIPFCDVHHTDLIGCTALHYAAYHGHSDCVELLLSSSNLNQLDLNGNTPLMLAAGNGHFSSVSLLLPQSNCSLVNVAGRTALHCSTLNGHSSCTRLISEVLLVQNELDTLEHHTPRPHPSNALRRPL